MDKEVSKKANIKAVLFDMDGVIFDTEAVWKTAFFKSNEKFGLNFDENYRQKEMSGRTETDIRKKMKQEYPNVDIDAYRDYMLNLVLEEINISKTLLKAGFVETIEALKKQKIKISLATSSKLDVCRILFKNAGLEMEKVFDAIVTKDEVKNGKPNPEVFLKAAEKLGVSPANCVVFEDSILGIQAAHNAGAIPVMVVDLIKPNEETKKITKKVVYSLLEANDYVLNLIAKKEM